MSVEKRRILKETLIFAGVVAGGLVLIPLVMGVVGAWSGQALFSEIVRAFFTYFFHITIWASLGLYAVVMAVRLVLWGVGRLRT